ncbi:FAD-dependent oxidoreductase [Sphingomonas sp.]|uniref:FAD-dependent oxidoreductase n=1 Tax=Sphingomonas sp. TaxID=28214 RepID=UPI0035C78DA4
MIARRQFLSTAALGSAGLAVSGCATTAARTSSARSCLARVNAADNRVIRKLAGLRPFRRSGFVVRREALGDKALVHNYGHGGSGFTLAFGTARLAIGLGLPGHQGPVAVIGAGIVGLATARAVQEAGFPVTLYTAALPPETTSNIAGGQWHISALHDEDAVTPEFRAQLAAAQDYSWRRAQLMTGDDYGIRWLPTWNASYRQPRPDPYEPGQRWFAAGSHPFPGSFGMVRFETMYAETGRLLRQLERDIRLAGGRIEVRAFRTPAEVAALPERLVFNCTGLGAAALFGDAELTPVRGQLAILLPQPEVRYAYGTPSGYMFPRADGIVLGGTFERGVGVAEPQPADIADILADHRRTAAGLRCA